MIICKRTDTIMLAAASSPLPRAATHTIRRYECWCWMRRNTNRTSGVKTIDEISKKQTVCTQKVSIIYMGGTKLYSCHIKLAL